MLQQRVVRTHDKGSCGFYQINIDRDTKLIAASAYTTANVHDSQVLDAVLRDAGVGGISMLFG